MKLSRRHLLGATSIATIAGTALKGSHASAAAPGTKRSTESGSLSDWGEVRKLFDLRPDYAHLALFFLASHPRPVREEIEAYRQKIDANPLITVEQAMFDFQHLDATLPVRATNAIGKYIGADGQDIALTGNTTAGLSLVHHGLVLKAGDEVLTTEHDHFVHHEAIRYASERSGAQVRKISLFDPPSPASVTEGQIVERVQKALKPNTRVLALTWVHSSTGLKLPLRAIADAVGAENKKRAQKDRVRIVVDGVHGIGVEDPNIPALGCDAFAAGTHKWLFGPRGTGFVWAKPELWAEMRPLIPSFTSRDLIGAWMGGTPPPSTPRASWFAPGGFHAYEHYWATPVAIELHQEIGTARITERIHALNGALKEGLAKLSKVKLYTPRSAALSAGIVCFDVDGMKPDEVVKKLLEKKVIGSTTPYRVPYARLSFGIPNNEAEVEKALAALRTIA
jgi:selenocysteine lyase/cysteine desulfurase